MFLDSALDIEKTLLGFVMNQHGALAEMQAFGIEAGHFKALDHREIYAVAEMLAARGVAPTILALLEAMPRLETLLYDIWDEAPITLNLQGILEEFALIHFQRIAAESLRQALDYVEHRKPWEELDMKLIAKLTKELM